MVDLPTYNRNSRINTSPVVDRQKTGIAQNVSQLGGAIAKVAEQWQLTQNAAEALDGRNKLSATYNDIIQEANDYNEYKTPKDITQKQDEILTKLKNVLPEIADGFNTATNASDFTRQNVLRQAEVEAQVKGIFRRKYIDNAEANLSLSADRNREAFISSGSEAYRNAYLNDLETSYKGGFIDQAAYTQAKLKTQDWDKYMVYRQAETDPQAVIDGLKSGKYKIKPEEYNEVLKGLNSIKTNDELMRRYEEATRQNQGESDTLGFIYGSANYADKLKYINDAELKGEISESFATKARRTIKQFRPDDGRSLSEAQSLADILQRAYDLNEGSFTSEEYLNGIRDIRAAIVELHDNGEISTKDANAINNQLNNATRKRISQETNAVSYQYGKSVDFFKENLPPEFQNDAIRDLFYATQDLDDDLSDDDKAAVYNKKAVEIVDNIREKHRLEAQKAIQGVNNELPDIDINTMAAKINLSVDDFNRKIEHTAQKYGMTKEQALRELSKRMK